MAPAPSGIAPSRPMKAVSVTLSAVCVALLMMIGQAMAQIRRRPMWSLMGVVLDIRILSLRD